MYLCILSYEHSGVWTSPWHNSHTRWHRRNKYSFSGWRITKFHLEIACVLMHIPVSAFWTSPWHNSHTRWHLWNKCSLLGWRITQKILCTYAYSRLSILVCLHLRQHCSSKDKMQLAAMRKLCNKDIQNKHSTHCKDNLEQWEAFTTESCKINIQYEDKNLFEQRMRSILP